MTKKFEEMGSLEDRKWSGRPKKSVDWVQVAEQDAVIISTFSVHVLAHTCRAEYDDLKFFRKMCGNL